MRNLKLTKKEAEKKIDDFFKNIGKKIPEQVKKIKRLAMKYKINLKDKRKKFCKYCYSNKLKVKSIKKSVKVVECERCKKISRYKIK